jgi:Flp pilus assembly pilin Flp
MKHAFLKVYGKLQSLRLDDAGQDLVEYALLLTMISLALVTSMQGIASTLSKVFTNVSSTLT